MSLTDILGFDPAVRCYPLSLALPSCFLFYFLFPSSSLLHRVLHFTIFSSSPFTSLPLFTFPLSPALPPLRSYRSTFLCLSPGRRKETLQEIHLQRRGTVQQNTNDIFTWRRERNRRDGFTRERFIERYAKEWGEKREMYFLRKKRANSLSKLCGSTSI